MNKKQGDLADAEGGGREEGRPGLCPRSLPLQQQKTREDLTELRAQCAPVTLSVTYQRPWGVPHKLPSLPRKLSWTSVTMAHLCVIRLLPSPWHLQCLPCPSDLRSQATVYIPQVQRSPGPFSTSGFHSYRDPYQRLPPGQNSDLPSPEGAWPHCPGLTERLLGLQEQLPQLSVGWAQGQNSFAHHSILPLPPLICRAKP